VLCIRGCGKEFLFNIFLCIFTLMIGGIIHAWCELWDWFVKEVMG
jgi:uncharacterized membrane protein YqaE (UPF0057 family)